MFSLRHFHQKLTSRFSTTSATAKIGDGGIGGSAAAFSGCLPPALGKSPPLPSGWLLFFFPDCTLFALLASFYFFFCFAIIIVCAPNPIFLSFFTLFLAACWLSLIRRLHRPRADPFLVCGSSAWPRCSSSPSPRSSARNRRPRLGSPPWPHAVLLVGLSPRSPSLRSSLLLLARVSC